MIGRDEITIKEPLYVFAVSNLTATMTNEVNGLKDYQNNLTAGAAKENPNAYWQC